MRSGYKKDDLGLVPRASSLRYASLRALYSADKMPGPHKIHLTAKDIAMIQEGTKCQIIAELWRRMSEAISEDYCGRMDDSESDSEEPAAEPPNQ